MPQIGNEKAVWSSSTHWVFPANKGQDENKTAAAAVFVKWMNDNSLGWAETGELPAANAVREDPSLLEQYPNLAPFMDELRVRPLRDGLTGHRRGQRADHPRAQRGADRQEDPAGGPG